LGVQNILPRLTAVPLPLRSGCEAVLHLRAYANLHDPNGGASQANYGMARPPAMDPQAAAQSSIGGYIGRRPLGRPPWGWTTQVLERSICPNLQNHSFSLGRGSDTWAKA